jgi:PAS domain S-box-containing protein
MRVLLVLGFSLCLMAPARVGLAQGELAESINPAPDRVIAAVPRSWPPQFNVDENDRPIGFAIDVMNEVARRAGLTVDYLVVDSFSAAVEALARGDADLIPNSGILPERMDASAFTAPVETFVVSLFVRQDTGDIEGVGDLVGRSLAVVETNIGLLMFGERQDMDIHVYRDVPSALIALIAGQVDALVYPRPVILNLARKIGVDERIKAVGTPLKEVRRGIRVRKEDVELLAVLNEAVESYVGTAAYQQTYVKWYGSPNPFWTGTRVAWLAGAILVLALVSALIAVAWWRYRFVMKLNQRLQDTAADRARAEESLRESERRLQSAMQIAELGYFSWDLIEDRCIYCSEEYAAFHGMSVEEYMTSVTNLESDAEWVHPDDRARYDATLQTSFESGDSFELEYRILGKDGVVRYVRERETYNRLKDGVVATSEGTLQDITDVKKAEESLRQAQKMEMVGQLTGGLAHDFNNLLAVIQGNAELLAEDLETDDPMVESIIRASKRGEELTQRLLAFSRQQSLRPQSIDVAELTTGMSTLLKRTLGGTIEIATHRSSDLWPIMADPGQLENALLNLAINARDAMPEGGTLTIECVNASLDEDSVAQNPEGVVGDYVVLAVSDTGEGMSEEVQKHACEPFFTTKEVGKGSGLGLSMIYGFAKQSGGYMSLYSELGRGTTVKLYLPRAHDAVMTALKEPDSHAPHGRGERVLVVEDDPEVRALAVRMLEGLRYRVITAPEAKSAQAVLEQEQVDLVLCDVVLPGGVSGPQFIEAALQDNPDMNVIFMSGYTAEAVKNDSILSTGHVLLNKPIRKVELAKALREALDDSGARAAHDPLTTATLITR